MQPYMIIDVQQYSAFSFLPMAALNLCPAQYRDHNIIMEDREFCDMFQLID